ncbi:MAG: hypothetical protein A3F74_09970 [Betaproteobacteria bacterium RIFCSPLOWO2_12_FULL_62_58]|nr:MAG: hypothetical protein A3F74_09970 [Betaproteobacteria bacterium RIFCSPLOWO2_12_FULL_62_58]
MGTFGSLIRKRVHHDFAVEQCRRQTEWQAEFRFHRVARIRDFHNLQDRGRNVASDDFDRVHGQLALCSDRERRIECRMRPRARGIRLDRDAGRLEGVRPSKRIAQIGRFAACAESLKKTVARRDHGRRQRRVFGVRHERRNLRGGRMRAGQARCAPAQLAILHIVT